MDPPPRNPVGTSRTAPLVVRSGISTNDDAERTIRELRGSILRPFLGPRSSSFERLQQVCMFGS
eukprot:12102095-Alexandrium_andersonii.AAC.1